MKGLHQNINAVRGGICSVSGAAQQLCTKTLRLVCATQPPLQLVLPRSSLTRELRRWLLGACLSPVSILRPCAFLGGSVPSFTNICLGALDFLLLLVWGKWKRWEQMLAPKWTRCFKLLHCIHFITCSETMSEPGRRKRWRSYFFAFTGSLITKKNKPKAATIPVAPKGTRRGGLFSHASTSLQSCLKNKGVSRQEAVEYVASPVLLLGQRHPSGSC